MHHSQLKEWPILKPHPVRWRGSIAQLNDVKVIQHFLAKPYIVY
jgi:hypothetical protein